MIEQNGIQREPRRPQSGDGGLGIAHCLIAVGKQNHLRSRRRQRASPGIEGLRKIGRIVRRCLKIVAKTEIHREARPNLPGVLDVSTNLIGSRGAPWIAHRERCLGRAIVNEVLKRKLG